MSISYPNFLDWVRDNRSFSALAAYRADDFNLTGMGEAERVPAEMISASFFPLLGVKPVIGRAFRPEEDQVGAAPVVLISSGMWKRKFGSSPDVLGKSMTLNGTAYTIVGVIPADFHYASGNFHPSDVYVPIGQWNDPTFRDRKTHMGMNAVGRLKPGVSFAQAKADMEALGRHLAAEYPEADKGSGITLIPLKQDVVGDIQPILLVLLAAVGFVLLIACVNVANLLLARSTGRTREFAIRSALGATRGRVIRQLLTESILLALSGGGLGLVLASWGLKGALDGAARGIAPSRGSPSRRARAVVYARRFRAGGHLVRLGPGAQEFAARSSGNAQGGRARVERPPASRPEGFRGRGNGARGRPAGGRRTDDSQPLQALERRSGIRSPQRADLRLIVSRRDQLPRCHSRHVAPDSRPPRCRARH